VAVMLVSVATAAAAADGAGNYAIWGVGSRSCNQFLGTGVDEHGIAPFRQFVMGYLTAYNTLQDETYNALGEMPLPDAMDWLADYCDLHRLDSFERAIMQLVLARHEQRQHRAPGAAKGWGAPGAASRDAR
jgi:hypothetical protein